MSIPTAVESGSIEALVGKLSPFTEVIDFSKYGLNINIDDITSENKYSSDNITPMNGDGIKELIVKDKTFTINRSKYNSGSYGQIFKLNEQIDACNLVVKIISIDPSQRTNLNNTIKESIMQILICEATKDLKFPEIGLEGPFAPRLFYIGINDAKTNIYIIMELLEKNIYDLAVNTRSTTDWKIVTSSQLKTIVLQLSIISKILFDVLLFNHRDLLPSNIMTKTIDGKLNIRFIDFGLSCMTYKELQIFTDRVYIHRNSSIKSLFPSKVCNSRSRDIHFFIYNLLFTTKNFLDNFPIKKVFHTILASNQNEQERYKHQDNVYAKYNLENQDSKPTEPLNLRPDVVYDIFNSIEFIDSVPRSRIGSSWLTKLNTIYPMTITFLDKYECSLIKDKINSLFDTIESMDNTGKQHLLFYAIKETNTELFDRLIRNDVLTNIKNSEGKTPLHVAVRNAAANLRNIKTKEFIDSFYIVQQLVNNNPILINVKDAEGYLPYRYSRWSINTKKNKLADFLKSKEQGWCSRMLCITPINTNIAKLKEMKKGGTRRNTSRKLKTRKRSKRSN